MAIQELLREAVRSKKDIMVNSVGSQHFYYQGDIVKASEVARGSFGTVFFTEGETDQLVCAL
jgi:hypothetical protein